MANLFDTANAASTEPTEIVAGTLVQWKRPDLIEDYPIATYDLIYRFRLKNGTGQDQTITATNSGGDYLATLTGATTSSWVAGEYYWQSFISRKSDSALLIIGNGELLLQPTLDQNGADLRTHAVIMLAKINSLLEGRADKDVNSYSIQGRSLSKLSITDLITWRDYYRKEVAKEKQTAAIAAGKSSGATIKARFL